MPVYLIKSLRPHQWSKNFLLFAGLLFSHQLFSWVLLCNVFLGFAFFCLLSGGIYIVNDLIDLKNDQQHPLKRKRPVAAGKLSVSLAKKTAAVLLIGSLALAYLLDVHFALVCLTYAGMMLAYSVFLKKIAILDVIVISLGFVLRAVAGVVIIEVQSRPGCWFAPCFYRYFWFYPSADMNWCYWVIMFNSCPRSGFSFFWLSGN